MRKSKILALLIALTMVFGLVAACGGNTDAPAAPAPAAPAPADPAPAPADDGDDDDDQPSGGVMEAPQASSKDNIVILAASLPVSLIPWGSNDSASSEVNKQIYSHLFVLDYNTFEVVPEKSLAINFSQPDAQTTDIELRRDVVFHNGDPLTARDVAFSLRSAAESPHTTAIIGMLSDVIVHDDYNLTIKTDIPFAPIIRHLAHTAVGIVPMNYFFTVGADGFKDAPIGSGPFMFDSLALGEKVELVRNPNYWGNVPAIEFLSYRVVADPSIRLLEVQSGTADIALAVAPVDVPMAAADPNIQLLRRMNLSANYIGFNNNAPHLDNPLVRQAINYALDTRAIVDHVFLGVGAPLDGPLAPLVWGFSAQEPFEHNMDKARELLEEAGYNTTPGSPGGFSTTIWFNIPNTQREQISEMVEFSLAQLNINVEIIGKEWAAYLEGTENGEHDMFILGWVCVTGDADYGLYGTFHTDSFGAAGNRTFTSIPELDDLLDRGRSETNPATRLQIYADAQALIRDEAPWIFMNQGETLIAANPLLRGFEINPAGHHAYAPAWFE